MGFPASGYHRIVWRTIVLGLGRGLAITSFSLVGAGCSTKHPSEAECQVLEDRLGRLAVERRLPDGSVEPQEREEIVAALAKERAADPESRAHVIACQRDLSMRAYTCMQNAQTPEAMEACGK